MGSSSVPITSAPASLHLSLHLASDEAAVRIALGPLCGFAAPARCIHLHMMQLRAIARSIFASYPLEHGKLIRTDYFGACQLAPSCIRRSSCTYSTRPAQLFGCICALQQYSCDAAALECTLQQREQPVRAKETLIRRASGAAAGIWWCSGAPIGRPARRLCCICPSQRCARGASALECSAFSAPSAHRYITTHAGTQHRQRQHSHAANSARQHSRHLGVLSCRLLLE